MAQRIPLGLAEPWDNVGLLCGDPAAAVTGVMVTVDFHEAIAQEAMNAKCNYVLAYHPPLFKATARLSPSDLIWSALSRGMAVWSPHTSFDAVPQGTNDYVAELLKLRELRPLKPRPEEPTRGQGRIGVWHPEGEEFVSCVKRVLGISHLLVAGDVPPGPVRIAIAAGSGASLLDEAKAEGAQVFLTGEATHHDALRAARLGIALIATLHSNIERPSLLALAARLAGELTVPVFASRVDADPYRVV